MPTTAADAWAELHASALALSQRSLFSMADVQEALQPAHEMTDAFFSSPEWRQRQDAQLAGLLAGMGFDTGAER